jgi:HK97 family phage prohead protease
MEHQTQEQATQAILSGVGLGDADLSHDRIRQIKQSGAPQFRVISSTPESEADRVVRFVASDETPDRVGDVIEVAGWNLTTYKRNPVVLWGHDSSNTPPIGKAVNVRRGIGPSGKSALLASVEFAPKETHEFADTVYQLTKGGYLNAVSVGFLPRTTKDITDKERQQLGMPSYGLLYTSADLLEISVVSVPANPSALVTGAKGLVDSGILREREVSRFLKQIPMNEEELAKRLKSKIRGFVDLGALGKGSDAAKPEANDESTTSEDVPEEAPKTSEDAPEASELEAPDAESETKGTSIGNLKHIAAIEETEGTFVVTYLKAEMESAGYSEDDDDEDKPSNMKNTAPLIQGLIEAQTEQAKAVTMLVDSISDLTKRIHVMGEPSGEERRGFAATSDAAPSDTLESVRKEKAHIEQLTTNFTTDLLGRLNNLR